MYITFLIFGKYILIFRKYMDYTEMPIVSYLMHKYSIPSLDNHLTYRLLFLHHMRKQNFRNFICILGPCGSRALLL